MTNKKYKSLEITGYLEKNEVENLDKVTFQKWKKIAAPTQKARAGKPLNLNERNHHRLLLKKTESLLAEAALKRQPEWQPFFYLSELLQRNAFVLFDKEFKKHYKQLHKHGFVLQCYLLKELQIERTVTESMFTRQIVQRIGTNIQDAEKLLREHQHNFEWRVESYKVFLKNFSPMELKPVEKLVKPKTTWQKVYALRHQLHSSPAIDDKINVLMQLYKLTSRGNTHLLQRELATTCSNLATYLMIQGKFELSLLYFNKAVSLKKYFRPANYLMLQYNYVGLCLRNLRFSTAYAAMLDVDESIQRLPAVAFKWKILKSMCYIFAGKEKEIKNILPVVPNKKEPQDYIYFYVIWAIYFTHANKTDTAVQMIDTARGLSRRHTSDAGLQAFIPVIKKYHLYLEKYSRATAAVKTLLLLKNIDMAGVSTGNILPLIWFKKYLEKEAG